MLTRVAVGNADVHWHCVFTSMLSIANVKRGVWKMVAHGEDSSIFVLTMASADVYLYEDTGQKEHVKMYSI